MTNQPPIPTGLQKTDDRCLTIHWDDGVTQTIPFRALRKACRCAHCLEKHGEPDTQTNAGQPKLSNALPVLSWAETQPLEIEAMEPAGNYGYKIRFSDGHSSGIYPIELLRAIGDAAEEHRNASS